MFTETHEVATGVAGASTSTSAEPADEEALLATLLARAEAAGAEVVVIEGWDGLADLVGVTARGSVVVAPASASDALRVAAPAAVVVDDANCVQLTTAAALGIVHAFAAVAETGSVLVREDTLADRVVSMLAGRLMVLVDLADVVATLDAVADYLTRQSGRFYAALFTGPSRSADIERRITIGVQGPIELQLVVVR